MNDAIVKLKQELTTNHAACAGIQDRIQAEYNKVFDQDADIQDAIKALESGGEYTTDKYGDIQRWIRFETEKYKDCLYELGNYLLENHCMYLDSVNDCIQSSEGESLVINDDGDIFLGNKVVIHSDEYETESERNRLIEEYMEKSGYYPGVFRHDRNGNVSIVNTQSK